jgi:hypothetical protein
MRRVLLSILLCATFSATPVAAQPFETAGARALGMGGAFVGVADDATAVWWNPAGLASGALFSLAVERNRFETPEGSTPGAVPASERSAFFLGAATLPLGLSYVKTRQAYTTQGPADEPIVRDLVTHQAGLTVLQSLSDTVVAAATLKYVRGAAASRTSQAFDADFGILARAGALQAGLTLRNITSPEFEAPDGSTMELPWMARAGVSYLVSPALLMAIDIDLRAVDGQLGKSRMLAVGSEWRIGGSTRFAVRAGARIDTIGAKRAVGTVGGSYAVRNGMWVDVWGAGGSNDAERGWGLAGRIAF